MREEPVLIGFPASGKSTLACRLSTLTGLPVVSIDAIAPKLMPHLGMDSGLAELLYKSGQIREWLDYVRPFEHVALEIILSAHQECIFDVGAGHVTGNRPASLTLALKEFAWIIHVRTDSVCCDEVATCRRRLLRRLHHLDETAPDPMHVAEEMSKYFSKQWMSYSDLATLVIRTDAVCSSLAARNLVDQFLRK